MQSQETSIRVKKETHQALVSHLENTDRKIGRFTDSAIIEKIQKETSKKKKKPNDNNSGC